MSVTNVLSRRRSTRAFVNLAVPAEMIRRIVSTAARTPSGGNLQPWHLVVIAGAVLEHLKSDMRQRVAELPRGEPSQYRIYPDVLPSLYARRRFQAGEDLYRAVGIARDDMAARRLLFNRNFQLFGAPVGLFCYVHQCMGPPQWSDLGMYLQSVMLLAAEEGLSTCAQECWSLYPETIAKHLSPPQDFMLFCGMAIGYEDPMDPVNLYTSQRAHLDEFATFKGFD